MRILDDENEDIPSAMTGTNVSKINAEITSLIKTMPPRPVTDVLMQHFFSDVNWIYQMVYPTTFMARYNEWWAGPCQSVDDIQFATLLLRLCSYTTQFLPSQTYTADTILGNSLYALRERCNATAISLTRISMMEEGLPSITRIHEYFFHACYLKNEGAMKDSWHVLGKAIYEAHELGLHLETRRSPRRLVSECDIELGKRTHWNLWLWDKFMSIVLGRWPLIPEQRCTVSIPQDVFGTSNVSHGEAPNIFCERRLQIDLAKIASSILSSNSGKPYTEPAIINAQMKILKTDLIEKLPPAFRLVNPDVKWDEQLPHLRMQRQMFRISVYATICILLRPMIITSANSVRALSASDRSLAFKHRLSLIDAAIEVLNSVASLHSVMGGKQNRFFLLSFFTLEPAVLLGIYLMTPNIGTKEGRHGSSEPKSSRDIAAKERALWKHGFQKMEEAVARLNMLSEVSSIARTGLKVLEKMLMMIINTEMARTIRGEDETMSISSSSKFQLSNSPASRSRASTRSQLSSFPTNLTDGSALPSLPSQPNPDGGFGIPFTASIPYEPAQTQDIPSLVNATYNHDIQDRYSACDNTTNWNMNFNNVNITNDIPLLNPDATILWPEFDAQTAAAGASTTDATEFAPDITMDQNFDWSCTGNNRQQNAWFGM